MINQKRPKTLRGRVRRWFPERQFHIRTEGHVKFFRVSTAFQAISTCLLIGALIWTGFASWSFTQHTQIVNLKNNQISNARLAYHSLLGEVAEYQKKFTGITEDLESNHSMMVGLVEKNSSLRQSLNSVSRKLVATQSEREMIEAARETLKDNLSEIENQLRETASRNFSLKDNLSSVENNLQSVLEERNMALFEGARVRSELKTLENRRRQEIASLEDRINQLQDDQESTVERLANRAIQTIESHEKIIDLAGIDAMKLLNADSNLSVVGQGGPFIPATADDEPGAQLRANLDNLDGYLNRVEALQAVMKRMPLTPPLNTYRITSSFGKRRDPKNNKWSAHYGLDLASHLKSTIYSPAAGKVTFAGWKGNYGRMIEIDHGAGIKTRYGHLHKISVKKGQKIKFRDKIGLLGNSGRSTGAHLHYEIMFRGKSINPANFFKAGQYVFKE
ncbi:MAG: peptidoglycan DD-metalloendopeptidase family protein [Rhodospirillales bacterium]|nr:peptidoglycan DD-metalloendopeptidase family protein [Rhodospirillales bacterium]